MGAKRGQVAASTIAALDAQEVHLGLRLKASEKVEEPSDARLYYDPPAGPARSPRRRPPSPLRHYDYGKVSIRSQNPKEFLEQRGGYGFSVLEPIFMPCGYRPKEASVEHPEPFRPSDWAGRDFEYLARQRAQTPRSRSSTPRPRTATPRSRTATPGRVTATPSGRTATPCGRATATPSGGRTTATPSGGRTTATPSGRVSVALPPRHEAYERMSIVDRVPREAKQPEGTLLDQLLADSRAEMISARQASEALSRQRSTEARQRLSVRQSTATPVSAPPVRPRPATATARGSAAPKSAYLSEYHRAVHEFADEVYAVEDPLAQLDDFDRWRDQLVCA